MADATGSDSVRDNRQHIERLVRKRDMLNAAIGDAYEALLASVVRSRVTPVEAVELHQWARVLSKGRGTPHPHSPVHRMNDALPFRETDLRLWAKDERNIPGNTTYAEGLFPMSEEQWTPKSGQPCVYVLLAGPRVVYVGASTNVRQRLKSHWREQTKVGISHWRLTCCESKAEMVALEADLIADLCPRDNKAGNRFRNIA